MFEFDGILLEPCLLQPCFHVAGMCAVIGVPWRLGRLSLLIIFSFLFCFDETNQTIFLTNESPLLTLLESNFPGKSLGNPDGPGNSTP